MRAAALPRGDGGRAGLDHALEGLPFELHLALDGLDCLACFAPVSHLVYVSGREHVSHVWVNGETRVDKGIRLLHINDSELLRLASVWQTKVGN